MQNDYELIKEYQNGDRSAFDKIVRNHLSNTIGFFFTITRDRMVSEDLAQDVFFKLFRHLKNFVLNLLSLPISTVSTLIQQIIGSPEISGRVFFPLKRLIIKDIEIQMLKMNGNEKNSGVKLISYQKNNEAWL